MVTRLALHGSVLEKKAQTKDEEKSAQECIEILFEPKKTEYYGSIIRCEYGTRMNSKNMSNFAIPLVILTWHQMLQEYFWKNSNTSFFHFGHNSAQNKRNTKHSLDNLHLINGIGVKTKITSYEMICPNSDADVCKEACPSLL
jgi:hypothetical protein